MHIHNKLFNKLWSKTNVTLNGSVLANGEQQR